MTFIQILSLFGIPSFIFTSIIGYLIAVIKKEQASQEALKKGVQALLRAQMIRDYNEYSAKGYAPIYAKENFENIYKNYHTLGGNGVMQELYANFIELPTDKPSKE